jgi:uncharacterized protein (DUF2235 family)
MRRPQAGRAAFDRAALRPVPPLQRNHDQISARERTTQGCFPRGPVVKYSRATKIKFVGVWDTVGSLGLPLGSIEAKDKYRFLDTHLRLDNENAFHALALDEHRQDFEPTFWTKTVKAGETGAADRTIDKVEQRWFVGAHANVGGGYPSRRTRASPANPHPSASADSGSWRGATARSCWA